MWLPPFGGGEPDNFVYVTVSDGVGVGVVEDGEVFRGHGDTAGEFGHLPLSLDGPRCMCGLQGCLEAYTSNVATLARYFGVDPYEPGEPRAAAAERVHHGRPDRPRAHAATTRPARR